MILIDPINDFNIIKYRFKQLFLMPYNIIENFNLLKPIIFLDGTFMKETIVKGMLFLFN